MQNVSTCTLRHRFRYGGAEMNEKALAVLDQYDLEINETYRTRGNYGCETTTGKYIMQEYNNSNEKMATMKALYNHLGRNGFCTDYVIANKEGEFVSISEDGYTYILKRWFNGEECSITDINQICTAAELLGQFHKTCENTTELLHDYKGFHPGENMLKSFERHNKEIVQIKNYIKKRRNKKYFEMELQKIIDEYNVQAVQGLENLKKSQYKTAYESSQINKSLNHGSFNHHNIIFVNEKPVLINIMKINYAPQIQDLYDFLRKVMEKNNWNIEIGKKVMDSYDSWRIISADEYKILKALFSYPEKFWKIINYYYNSNKAWYSDKNEEKLKQFQKQEDLRWNFIENM